MTSHAVTHLQVAKLARLSKSVVC